MWGKGRYGDRRGWGNKSQLLEPWVSLEITSIFSTKAWDFPAYWILTLPLTFSLGDSGKSCTENLIMSQWWVIEVLPEQLRHWLSYQLPTSRWLEPDVVGRRGWGHSAWSRHSQADLWDLINCLAYLSACWCYSDVIFLIWHHAIEVFEG